MRQSSIITQLIFVSKQFWHNLWNCFQGPMNTDLYSLSTISRFCSQNLQNYIDGFLVSSFSCVLVYDSRFSHHFSRDCRCSAAPLHCVSAIQLHDCCMKRDADADASQLHRRLLFLSRYLFILWCYNPVIRFNGRPLVQCPCTGGRRPSCYRIH